MLFQYYMYNCLKKYKKAMKNCFCLSLFLRISVLRAPTVFQYNKYLQCNVFAVVWDNGNMT